MCTTTNGNYKSGASKPWLAALLLLAAGAAGCASAPEPEAVSAVPGPPVDAPPVPEYSEVAMTSGTEIVAQAPNGQIILGAGPGLLRKVTWAGKTRWAVVQPREERWAGSLGLYFEGTPPDWKPHQGMRRIKFEEGQRYFATVNDAQIWMQIRRLHFVHNSQGLVVGWKRLPDKATLQVEVWQFFIDGEKPTELPGAKDHLIELRQVSLQAANQS